MITNTVLNVETLENRTLLSVAQPVNNSSPSQKPNRQISPSSQPIILKSEVVWPPKLKNPPRIVIEQVLKPKVFLGMNNNDSFWYFPKSDRRYRGNIETDKKPDNITQDEPLVTSIQDSNLKPFGNSILSFRTE